ncbi:c-type cytochrome [Niveibacterium sp. SC-1]|uniref:c-type cytochrome n=1 Tax=Niveibacterium sp. SC-1 TaxID=3135646 RepID=UPI00311E1C4E
MSIRNALSLALISAALLAACDKPQQPTEEETATLIQPVAKVQLGEETGGSGGGEIKGNRTGEAIVTAACAACHATGTLNAPKIGDAAQWAPRIAQGLEGLLKSAAAGKGAMPPRGGVADLTDDELARAIAFMANKSGAKFEAPAIKEAAPAQTASADQAAAPTEGAKVDGKKVFDGVCTACHTAGVAGAPKVGDKAAWGPRLAQGADTLHKHAISGLNAMPPKGGNTALSDDEVRAAVDYMVAQAK